MTMMPTTCRRYGIQSARDQARIGARACAAVMATQAAAKTSMQVRVGA
jgi:hypothetical protein